MSEPRVIFRATKVAKEVVCCSWCERNIEPSWVYVVIKACINNYQYAINYHTWCDKKCRAQPPRGWRSILKEKP